MDKRFKVENTHTVEIWLNVHFSDGMHVVSNLAPKGYRSFSAAPGSDLTEIRVHSTESEADAAGSWDRCRGKVQSR